MLRKILLVLIAIVLILLILKWDQWSRIKNLYDNNIDYDIWKTN